MIQPRETVDVAAAPVLLHPIPNAAKILGVGRSTLYSLLDEGKLRSVYIGRRRLVPDAELKAFLARLSA
ncbi:helix-turn-helix domain-containing protein [Bosea sp. 117]|uniref:excisionase family DNA-binding protein n=1 Tax=Bosea sp. 117 TaxID=1125973 RepID=UPI00057021C1|nr:helix-turn-helix domain-containing protein [Bosea sp. 117]